MDTPTPCEFIAVKYCGFCAGSGFTGNETDRNICEPCKGNGTTTRDLTMQEVIEWAKSTISTAYQLNSECGANTLWVMALPNSEAIKLK